MQRQRDRYDILRNILDIVDKTQPPYRNYKITMKGVVGVYSYLMNWKNHLRLDKNAGQGL